MSMKYSKWMLLALAIICLCGSATVTSAAPTYSANWLQAIAPSNYYRILRRSSGCWLDAPSVLRMLNRR